MTKSHQVVKNDDLKMNFKDQFFVKIEFSNNFKNISRCLKNTNLKVTMTFK